MKPYRIDLLIAGMRRAGTTMLSNLLHMPPEQLSLVEPNLICRARFRKWAAASAAADRVVVKEIAGHRITETIRRFDVRQTVIVVRDAARVAQSIHEWHTEHGRGVEPLESAAARIVRNARFLVSFALAQPATPVLRYEDIVQDVQRLNETLGTWGLQTDGDLSARLTGREFEIDRHGGRITAASLHRRENETDSQRIELGRRVARKCERYQTHFGYDAGGREPRNGWLADVFSRGWRRGGAETVCGQGSTLAATLPLRSRWPELVETFGFRTVNDAGCGDLNWQRQLELHGIDYCAYDVVRWPSWTLADGRIHCELADVTCQPLRHCQLTLCRDVMIHLPNSLVQSALENFRVSSDYLLATSFDGVPNYNRMTIPGGFAPLDLRAEPFHLGTPLVRIDEPFPRKYLGLWRLAKGSRESAS